MQSLPWYIAPEVCNSLSLSVALAYHCIWHFFTVFFGLFSSFFRPKENWWRVALRGLQLADWPTPVCSSRHYTHTHESEENLAVRAEISALKVYCIGSEPRSLAVLLRRY